MLYCRWPSVDGGSYVDLFYDVADVIRTGKEPEVKWDEVITVLEVIESVHRSAREGRTVDLSLIS